MISDLGLIKEYFPNISQNQEKQFLALSALYAFWNEKINVVSRKDIDQLYLRHVLHSLAVAKFIEFQPQAYILDLGTGGGFPGIPLAVLFPESNFLLVDSIQKKIKVVSEIIHSLDLKNVQAKPQRGELVNEKFDFVVSRAVAPAKKLWEWCGDKIKRENHHDQANGLICLKGGDLQEELNALGRPHKTVTLQGYFPYDFFQSKKLVYIPVD